MDSTSQDNVTTAFLERRTDILGPAVISTFVQGVQMGLITSLFTRFWSRVDREPGWVKAIVLFVTAAGFFQTGAAFWTWWEVHVEKFPDIPVMLQMTWSQRGMFAIILCMSAPVQAFLVWRCWVVPLSLIILGCAVSSLYSAVLMISSKWAPVVSLRGPLIPIEPSYVVALVLPAALDMIVTAILLTFLIQHYFSIPSKRTRLVLSQLMLVAWEAAVPPSFCAIASVVMLIIDPSAPSWANMLQSILGKLYVMSLLFTLNSRADIAEMYYGSDTSPHLTFTTSSFGIAMPWRSRSCTQPDNNNIPHFLIFAFKGTDNVTRGAVGASSAIAVGLVLWCCCQLRSRRELDRGFYDRQAEEQLAKDDEDVSPRSSASQKDAPLA
ncbi:hypothetical protein K488DRAFT_83869 [Vararia minispora EC-137]|uniref:Uncharacterized protein n=1 Tax=Vararia minispora EC-137 TaxID=1314806 RepID=A0ACB8QRW6_9AGAM|nr:hypothetical protein K488DRAFT_83869 [Vararia minispora EC-137]